MKLQKVDVTSIIRWKILIILTLLPLIFLPITQEFYDTNKWALLVLVALVTVLAWVYKLVRTSSATISFSPVTMGLGAITVSSILSIVLVSPNKIEALTNPFGPVTFLCLTLISSLFPSFHNTKTHAHTVWMIFITGTALALIAIYQFFGMGKVMFPGVLYLADPLWTPTGSTVATMTILVIIIPLLIAAIRRSSAEKKEISLSLTILMTVIVAAGLGVIGWQLSSRIAGTLLPVRDGWAIMLEILKNPKQALFGVGADNFLTAFSVGRPVSLNLSPLWSVRFTTNSNMLFHLITIYGLIGGAAFVLLFKAFVYKMKKNALTLSLFLGLIILLLSPPNFSMLVILVSLLLSIPGEKVTTVRLPGHSLWTRIGISVVAVLLVAVSLYGFVKNYYAELTFFRSLTFAKQNNGTATYNTQVAAIKQNPYVSKFHIIFSQTNMALATSLANTIKQTPSSDKTATDQATRDRQLVAQLIQQAIAEAKTAVSLNPQNVLAWENLSRTYAQLIGVAQGADNWSVAGYNQAIQLDPTNPVLHLELGSVLVQTKNYTDGITEFQRSAALKPNYANAFYNLSNTYKLNNNITQSIAAMEKTLTLVDKTSDDYRTVTTELENLRKSSSALPATTPGSTTSPSTSLTKPSPTPEVVPPLTLPTGSGPAVSP